MLTVYRVQDKDGRGPWAPGISSQWVEDREDHDNLPPFYVEFGPIHAQILYGEHAGTGCQTLGQLRRWFTSSEYASLSRLGYKAVKMEAGRILASSNVQCFFGRAKPLNEDIEEVEMY